MEGRRGMVEKSSSGGEIFTCFTSYYEQKIITIMSRKRFPAIMQLPGSEMQRGDIGSEGQQMIKRTRGKSQMTYLQ